MPVIKAFKAIRPNPLYADHLVVTSPQTESVAGNLLNNGDLPTLKDLLETGARLRPETPDQQTKAYQDINSTLQELLVKQRLWQEDKPGIYVYEIAHVNYRQAGIWALTDLSAYSGGDIKTHELTFADSVRRLKNFREHTGLEGSPVLLTYQPSLVINRIIAETKAKLPKSSVGNRYGFHRLWKIGDQREINRLIDAFAQVKTVYLADGHHRLESADRLAAEQQAAGGPVFSSITSLYIASDQLRIQEFDRVVMPDIPVDRDKFLERLALDFNIQNSAATRTVRPVRLHTIGMYLKGAWYHLEPKEHLYTRRGHAKNIDATILQDYIFEPLFGIVDPRSDQRLKCIGGEMAVFEIKALIGQEPDAIAFTLSPITVDQLMAVADAGEILPPKSTWIDPKVPYGILLHQHNTVKG